MKKTETRLEERKVKLAEASRQAEKKISEPSGKVILSKCNDKNCHIHGSLKARGRVFEGRVIKKFHKRIVIEFERMIYIRKYERYQKAKTKIHAKLPDCIEPHIQIGDIVRVQECRPLSKIIHFVVIAKVNKNKEKK